MFFEGCIEHPTCLLKMEQSVGVCITPAKTSFISNHFLSRGLGCRGHSIISCSSHTEGGCLTSSRVSQSTLVNGAGKTPELPMYRGCRHPKLCGEEKLTGVLIGH
ncbi:uncharacterized protein LOC133183130 [Saccostrea echinata]|uniref:uncharacterized protein LOC133183130 n=1 Tax=Saccostrea echinata TaxID=191078 RepID=UPI002A80792E|nr:uncharacterized protein LOC133183130 [Saccostrea echinata]